MDLSSTFARIYRGKRVLVTGHTGFKGSWLVYWLNQLGAEVCGLSLSPPTNPNHIELLKLDLASEIGDIRDGDKVNSVFNNFQPEAVFHLAAQSLVRQSYADPVETYSTNLMGTIQIFEACRQSDSVRAIINVTSDKCYENREWVWGYREIDPMGGYDPYSASKGCSELLTNSYRNSFFPPDEYGESHQTLLASCRAGNVIGGGDWAQDRLVPDIVIATEENRPVQIRNPNAIRPWQHVLEPLSGYLQVGQKLLEGKREFAEGWNFGPDDEGSLSVGEVVEEMQKHWPKIQCEISSPASLHEAQLLKLDCSKANFRLGWKPVWSHIDTFQRTVEWYRSYYEKKEILTEDNLKNYCQNAIDQKVKWAT